MLQYEILAGVALLAVAVIGLFYGLMERSKRQAAESKADTIAKSLVDQISESQDKSDRDEKTIALLHAENARVTKDLYDSKLTVEDLRKRLNSALAYGVPAHSDGSKPPSVPPVASPGSSSDAG